jgi:TRAP-type C4-dicarboxylate transport system permease small subunit
MPLSDSFKTLGSFYERAEEVLLVSLVILMVSLGFLQVLFRNLISVGIVWIDPLVRHLVLWVALLGASVAIRENRHITIDIISGHVSPGHYSKIQGAVQLFSALICFLLTFPAIRFVQNDYVAGKTLAFGIPLWFAQAVMPVMLLIMGGRFLLQGIKKFSPEKRGKKR